MNPTPQTEATPLNNGPPSPKDVPTSPSDDSAIVYQSADQNDVRLQLATSDVDLSATQVIDAERSSTKDVKPKPNESKNEKILAPVYFSWDQLVAAFNEPTSRSQVVLIGLMGVALVACFWTTLVDLVHRWYIDPNYGHGFFVLVVSLYLLCKVLYERSRTAHERVPMKLPAGKLLGATEMVLGTVLVLMGFVIRLVTNVMASLIVECAAMMLVLAGVIILVGGFRVWKRYWGAVLFLVFMVPWPRTCTRRWHSRCNFLSAMCQRVCCRCWASSSSRRQRDQHHERHHVHRRGMQRAATIDGVPGYLCLDRAADQQTADLSLGGVFISDSDRHHDQHFPRDDHWGDLHFGGIEWVRGTLHTIEGLLTLGIGFGMLMLLMWVLDWITEPDVNGTEATVSAATQANTHQPKGMVA